MPQALELKKGEWSLETNNCLRSLGALYGMAGENKGVKDEVQSGKGGGCSEDDDLGSVHSWSAFF